MNDKGTGKHQQQVGSVGSQSHFFGTAEQWLKRTDNLIIALTVSLPEGIRLAGGIAPFALKIWKLLRAEGLMGIRYRFDSRTRHALNREGPIAFSLSLFRTVHRAGGIVSLGIKTWNILRTEGSSGLQRRIDFWKRQRALSTELRGLRFPQIAVAGALANAQRWCTPNNPEVSILIVNWNATQLTLECVRQIWANTEHVTYEIIIVDNGSDAGSVIPLKKLGSGARLIELGTNRFFGEANNIAAEHAAGKFICLLNNDAFVKKEWLRSLVEEIKIHPETGAVGPMFLYPDGKLQEAGCIVDSGGYPTQIGQYLDPAMPDANVARFVDYISAATLLMEKQLFLSVGGFDLSYEPAYYEDTDLCFKLLSLGRKTRYCPSAKVVHVLGAAANDNESARQRRKSLGDLNRGKFVARWGDYLKTRSDDKLPKFGMQVAGAEFAAAQARRSGTGNAAVFTPFNLAPGGGERYLLTLAAVLGRDMPTLIVTPYPYSQMRARHLGSEFGIDLSSCELVTYEKFAKSPTSEFMFTLGNQIIPSIPAHAQNSWYHCQFPFPMERRKLERSRDLLTDYKGIIVNSEYTKAHTLRVLKKNGLPLLPTEVIYPPVCAFSGRAEQKKNIILTVGRFFIGGHSKRQDLMIAAFCEITKKSKRNVELHLAGSLIPEPLHMRYLENLQKMAEGFAVKFHVNATQNTLHELYTDAAVYWHGAGLGCDCRREPEKAEHFGISIVEAMSAECVPLAFNAGGPREIITHGTNGFLYDTKVSLVELTLELLDGDGTRRIEMGRASRIAAARYTVERFTRDVRRLVNTH